MADDGNGEYIFLLGQDRAVWWDTPLRDLVALYAREYEDAISSWLTEKALFYYNRFIGHRFQKVSLFESTSVSNMSAEEPSRHVDGINLDLWT